MTNLLRFVGCQRATCLGLHRAGFVMHDKAGVKYMLFILEARLVPSSLGGLLRYLSTLHEPPRLNIIEQWLKHSLPLDGGLILSDPTCFAELVLAMSPIP